MSKRKILYFDMDGVLVDFVSGINRLPEETVLEYQDHLDDVPGIFALMDPMPGAIEAVKFLAKQYDVYVLSTAPWNNPSAWADKVRFVQTYFPDVFHKRVILTHDKSLLRGHYLVDDRPGHGASLFKGIWIQFGSDKFPDWKAVVDYMDTGWDYDRENYLDDLERVTKALITKVNADLSSHIPKDYPAKWKVVDWLCYEFCIKGYSWDDIYPDLCDHLYDMIDVCCKNTLVNNGCEVLQEFIYYLEERSKYSRIQDYHWFHG